MKQVFILVLSCLFVFTAKGQSVVSILVKDSGTQEPIAGATVAFPALAQAAPTGPDGNVVFISLPNGKYLVMVSHLGYNSKRDTVIVTGIPSKLEMLLEATPADDLDEVIISTTRSSRTISNIPTRVEVIAGEELDEKANMKPGDIRMVLNESTGIQTQQTSATSANASIRIQGLDGRYTQILKDGFPVYSGAASGLGLLQTAPLDLKQVEVIKGSASTLYGGGAIAGLVNLISKTPRSTRELSTVINGTSAGGIDISGFYGKRYGKAGVTIFASRNNNAAFAPGNADFTAIPKFTRYTLNPKVFLWFDNRTSLNIGLNGSIEDRTGGDPHYIRGKGGTGHSYFERNKSDRLSSQISLSHSFGEKRQLSLRNSVSYFKRRISTPGYGFNGSQYGTFSEASYSAQQKNMEWVAGVNLVTDKFGESLPKDVPLRDYIQTTAGLFLQTDIHLARWLEIETGIRGDYVADYGFSLLPRLSALFTLGSKLTSRLGGGLGYKAPTIFTEESERIQYRDVLPVSANVNKLERSYGINWDFNYKTPIGEALSLSLNHLFFYTRLSNPLIMQQLTSGQYRFSNVSGHFDSQGMETNLKLTYRNFKLFTGYTLTEARLHTGGTLTDNPLTAKHRLNNVITYEAEGKWKLGLEAYYYSRQKLSDGASGKPYWIAGFMAERLWKHFSLYINFENFTDTRQTRFDSIYTGSITNPVFRDIYAPLDGFVVNGGMKFRF